MTAATGSGSRTKWPGWMLVVAQFILLAVIVLAPAGDTWPVFPAVRVISLAMLAAGLAMIGWASFTLGREITPHPAPTANAELRTDGPYGFVRHPIYTGVIVLAAGVTIGSGSLLRALAFVLLVAVLSVKARYEEKLLTERFPGYPSYAHRTPRLFPRIGGSSKG